MATTMWGIVMITCPLVVHQGVNDEDDDANDDFVV